MKVGNYRIRLRADIHQRPLGSGAELTSDSEEPRTTHFESRGVGHRRRNVRNFRCRFPSD